MNDKFVVFCVVIPNWCGLALPFEVIYDLKSFAETYQTQRVGLFYLSFSFLYIRSDLGHKFNVLHSCVSGNF